ncbi:30S ribosomal protein S15 [Chytridiales sp. JEL 0842]|nr:30S ribosomal protein S15 [Chytridiales sp. JEL 0842]
MTSTGKMILMRAAVAAKPQSSILARPFHTSQPSFSRLPALYRKPTRNGLIRQERKETLLSNRINKKRAKRRQNYIKRHGASDSVESGGKTSGRTTKEPTPKQILRMRERAQQMTLKNHIASASLNPPVLKPVPPAKILPFLAKAGSSAAPAPIKPYDLVGTLEALKLENASASSTDTTTAQQKESSSIRHRRTVTSTTTIQTSSSTRLSIPEDQIPPPTLETDVSEAPSVAFTRSQGPAFSNGVTTAEARFLLVDAPSALKSIPRAWGESASQQPEATADGALMAERDETLLKEQAEMVRRVVSLENAGKKEVNSWNRARMVELFGRSFGDTGSPEVQAAVFTVKIEAMKEHLTAHKKDKSTKRRLQAIQSKRTSILQYLRRKDLPKFVETCRALGIDPELIQARA